MVKNKTIKAFIRGAICFAFWMAVWYILSAALGRALVLPTPFAVFGRLLALLPTADFWLACLGSVLRIFVGLIAGILAGVLLASLCAVSKLMEAIFEPLVTVIKATPVASIIILMLFIMAKSAVPMVAALLMVIPIVFGNVKKGITSVPVDLSEVAEMYDFGFGKRMKYLVLPSVLPYFSAACRSALGLAWKAGIAAEVICYPKYSIGANLNNAKVYLESEELYAWTIVVIVISVLIEKGVVSLLDLVMKKGGVSRAEAL
ncbi:MAG: ABC transporter permease subunit [Clostridia bacterium]|nr:ABC transporter permease subunit [Clostridia bacterium]MBQ8419761.1 ABC transporter permease subunit [Clostridia bacterium]